MAANSSNYEMNIVNVKKDTMRTVETTTTTEKMYSYDEAINLTGNGWYSVGLLGILSMATLAMGLEMFDLSIILAGATCDFQLDLQQTSIILSMLFIGPIVMAYPWGYICDTKGRKRTILIGMWVSYLASSASALSPNWIVLAVLKFISSSFCSSAQSTTYTMLGECISERRRVSYMLIMTSVLVFSLPTYVVTAYFVLNMEFEINLGLITFTPWRLLTIFLALPLGLGALGMHFFHESPKFMLNTGQHEEAIEILKSIWKRNGRANGKYPVNNVYLNEEGNIVSKDIPLLQSLWGQIVPLFKPPLLKRSLALYSMIAVIYGTNNSYFLWFPYLSEKFVSYINSFSNEGSATNVCKVINSMGNVTDAVVCIQKVDIKFVWFSLAQGISFVVVLLSISKLSHRKRSLTFGIFLGSGICAFSAVLINEMITSFAMFFGFLMSELCIAIVFSYFVDLYPTSFRGMAACIGVMVARTSALSGINILGLYIMSNCSATFFVSSALCFFAAFATLTLPADKTEKSTEDLQ